MAIRRFSPASTDLAIGSLVAGLWCAVLAGSFDRNASSTDLLLFAFYLLAYFGAGLVVCWALRCVAETFRILPAARLPRSVLAIAVATAPLVLVVFALQRVALPRLERSSPATLAGERANAGSPLRSIQLLGIDGIDPELLIRLVAAGELPNFAQVIRRGVSGTLKTVSPHSPVIWTSIATGAPPAQHRVLSYTTDFIGDTYLTAPDHRWDLLGRLVERVYGYRTSAAVSSNERRMKALWEILSERGMRSLVLNWWASYPAEEIDGIVVSNRAIPWAGFRPADLAELDGISNLVSPDDLSASVRATVHEVVEERNASEVRGKTHRYFEIRDEIALRLFERLRDPSDALATVYVQGVDTGSHAYTNAVFGGVTEEPGVVQVSDDRDGELFAQLVSSAYHRMDEALGRLLEGLPRDAGLIVVSDHGWHYDGTGHLDPPPGVFLAYGAAFRAGVSLEGHVYDVLPTIAHLLGIPISRALPGRILAEALSDPAASEPTYVDAYGPRRGRTEPVSAGSDRAHIERLRALGYLE